jgi:ribonuclease-3
MDEATPGLSTLQETLGHRFTNPDLLIEALTHPSAVKRRGISRRGYERLEFLGDRVLGLVIAELVWRRFPQDAEGELTRRQAHLVRREALSEVAQGLDLGARLIISKGEESAGVRKNKSVLADACEAVIAALYLDGGLDAVRPFIEQRWEKRLSEIDSLRRDPKTALQEYVQGRGFPLPAYKVFTVTVKVEGLDKATATASGTSKRGAEIAAAAAALSALGLAS